MESPIHRQTEEIGLSSGQKRGKNDKIRENR